MKTKVLMFLFSAFSPLYFSMARQRIAFGAVGLAGVKPWGKTFLAVQVLCVGVTQIEVNPSKKRCRA